MLATAALTLALASAGPTSTTPTSRSRRPPWVYREGDQRVEVTVTDRTKLIANGVVARVVRDEVTLQGRARRDHRRLLRPGRPGQRVVPRRGHHRVRERQARLDRGLLRGRRRRRAGRDRHARPSEGRHALPPGALQGPRRGPGEDRVAARAREGPAASATAAR